MTAGTFKVTSYSMGISVRSFTADFASAEEAAREGMRRLPAGVKEPSGRSIKVIGVRRMK